MHFYNTIYRTAILVTVITLLGIKATHAQQNYVRSRTPNRGITTNTKLDALTLNKDSVQTTIQYIDGLGRPLQTVQRQASPSSKDIVQPFVYDQYGREITKYLPYATSATGDGSYKSDALTPGFGVAKFYHPTTSTGPQQTNGIPNTTFPFAQTALEPSPLNRVVEQGAPGSAWQLGNSHTSRIVYTTNNDSTFSTSLTINNKGSRRVALYTAFINANQSRTLGRVNNNAVYDNNQLMVTISRNENWQPSDGCFGTTEEYKDKEGHVILKRTYNLKKTRDPANGNTVLAAEQLSTYYVYDDLGNLCFVLPPGASPDNNSVLSQATIDFRCYQYRYDQRNRLVQKKIPSKGWEYIIYNKLDQPVATQDSVQRMKASQEWTITKYDAMGRTVLNGIYQQSGTTVGVDYHVTLQAIADTTSAQWETPVTTGNGYTAKTWPKTWATTLSVNYYDNYTGIPGFPSAYDKTSDTTYSNQTTGLLTASKALVLNTAADYLWSVPYYDKEGQTIRTFTQHYVGGTTVLSQYNYDDVQTTYNFLRLPSQVRRFHFLKNAAGTAGTLTLTETNTYTYDHIGRKRTTQHQMRDGNNTSQTSIRLALIEYNEIGQLKVKRLHSINNGSNWLQTIDYRYNPRGWLTNINNANLASDTGKTNSGLNDLFGEELSYDDATTATQQYNGNIATVRSKSGQHAIGGIPKTPDKLTYDYTYDHLNRLRAAVSTTNTPKDGYYDENVVYDNMGNIQKLNRYEKINNARTVIDSLNYKTYSFYRISRIDDTASYTGTAGFRDLKKKDSEYIYDGNGNELRDQNSGISSISYNVLNLPQTMVKDDGSTVVYIYSATGNKLRKIFTAAGNVTTTEYDNGIQYDNSTTTVAFIQTEEGRARKSGSVYVYEYDLKDHLGNTRVTITPDPGDVTQQTAKVLQESDYYAFGYGIQSLQPATSPKNEYLYNHKELQEETGLYDYGARFYDPVIGRWMSVDRFAEKYSIISPYQYVANNPIKNIDAKGDSIFVTANLKGDNRIWDSFKTMQRTSAGRAAFLKFQGSTTNDIYVSGENGRDNAIMYSQADVGANGMVKDGEINTRAMGNPEKFENMDGHKVKPKNVTGIIGVAIDRVDAEKYDKYDLAMSMYHEMVAHIEGAPGSEYLQHAKFGQFGHIKGIGLHSGITVDGNDFTVAPNSKAWEFMKQLLQLKISDGNGTERNKSDLRDMLKYEKDHKDSKN